MNLFEASLKLERETNCDSILTIQRVYDGECVFPGCHFHTRDSVKMWRHVHFGAKHGRSFGKSFTALMAEMGVEV